MWAVEVIAALLTFNLTHWAIMGDNTTPVNDNGFRGHISLGDTLKLATWNCGGLSHTQRDMCGQLDYDILALTETHDSGCLRSTKHFITGDAAPRGTRVQA